MKNYARKFTDEQIKAALDEGVAAGWSRVKMAEKLGLTERNFRARVYKLAKQGHPTPSLNDAHMKRRGYSPEHDMVHVVPEGYKVKGVSTYYNSLGIPTGQWVKSSADEEKQRAIFEASLAAAAETLPRVKPRKASLVCDSQLLNNYVITDFHLGMLSWHEETGADWDINKAERLLVDWFGAAIKMAPDAETAIFAELGDFLHWDGLDAVTPASRHQLDADTRFQKVVRAAIRVKRRIIDMLLSKHEKVIVLSAEGNHDPASSIWQRELLRAIYENEPRVTVDVSPDPYYCVEHGQTSLFFHHGHKRKVADVDSVFAAKFREVFGRTKHSYAHMGHLHHVDVKETNLMIVEQHRTLAAPDAYAARGGWVSGRDAKVITYHKQYGEVGRLTISPQMVTFED